MLVNFIHPFRFPPAPPAGTVLHSSDTPGSSSYVVIPGITSVTIKIWGGGAGGSGQMVDGGSGKAPFGLPGYGGGGGAYSEKTITVSPGDTLAATIGAGGAGGSLANYGVAGGATTFSFGLHSLSAGGGTGAAPGVGGSASGGSTNTSGRNGSLTNQWDGGGAGNGGGDQTDALSDGTSPGGGGAGHDADGLAPDYDAYAYGGDGQPGRYQVIVA